MPTSYRGREYDPDGILEPFEGAIDHARDQGGAAVYLTRVRGGRAVVMFDHEDTAEVRVFDRVGTTDQCLQNTITIPRGQARWWSEPLTIGENRPVAYVVVKKE